MNIEELLKSNPHAAATLKLATVCESLIAKIKACEFSPQNSFLTLAEATEMAADLIQEMLINPLMKKASTPSASQDKAGKALDETWTAYGKAGAALHKAKEAFHKAGADRDIAAGAFRKATEDLA